MIVALVVAGVLLALVILVAMSLPKIRQSAGDLQMHRIADDVWFYRGYFSNSPVFVLKKGVLVIDTQVAPAAAKRLRREIERITDKPVRWVVNTHYHGDHTGGNAAFPEAEIIATELCARYVVERDAERVEYANTFGLEFQEVHPTIGPTRTFERKLVFDADGETIEVLQIGRCETPDACVVHWPARRAVAVGDGVATIDYPFLGVPFMDEGLRDDGEWIGFLEAIKKMKPEVMLPGHGPAMVGEATIAARLDLLASLFRDLIAAVRRELDAKTPLKELVDKVHAELAHYPARPDLEQHTVSQHFAIYRCVNNMSPDRKGKGWWHDLRPSVIRRGDAKEAEAAVKALDAASVRARAIALVDGKERPRAITLLEAWLRAHDDDAEAWALLADVFFDGAQGIKPTVDATEYFVASTKAAKKALASDPDVKLGLLNLGCAEVFGGMVLAQSMTSAIDKIERALAHGDLTANQRRKGEFFLGKAHQMELRDEPSDRHYRRVLPAPLRPLYPLLRSRMRAFP